MKTPRYAWTLLFPVLWVGSAAAAQDCPALLPEDARLLSVDGGPYDLFGTAVATSQGRIAVGAVADNNDGAQAGSVWVFAWNGTEWEPEARLIAEDTVSGDNFGWAVDLDDDVLIVGAWRAHAAGNDSGAAYVFRRSGMGWVQEAKLVGSDTEPDDLFGSGVAIQGDTAVVGGWWHDTDGLERAGQAYVFRRAAGEWSEVAKLAASDREAQDQFGLSVDVDQDRVVVGAWLEQTLGLGAGAVYVFQEAAGGTWQEEQKLLGSDVHPLDRLGRSVAIEGETLVFGGGDNSSNPGSAYVFEHDGEQWVERARLSACDPITGDDFGISVALTGDFVVVGAGRRHVQEPAPGAAYRFVRTGSGWVEHSRLFASGTEAGNQFGIAVAADTDHVVVGANWSGALGQQSGAAYVFGREGGPGESYCDNTGNSTGYAAWISATGSASIAADELVLRAFVGPGGQHGMFFYGSQAAQLPFGDGFLCVSPFAPGLIRLEPVALISAGGVATLPVSQGSLPAAGEIEAGSTWYFQFWYRDPLAPGGTGFNLSDGLRITFEP